MTEIWQTCPMCQGRGWYQVENAALYYEDTAGNKLDNPEVRTATQTFDCNTCIGTGRVIGGNR